MGGIMLVKIAALCEGGSGLATQAAEYASAQEAAVKSHDARVAADNTAGAKRGGGSGDDSEDNSESGSGSDSSGGSESSSESDGGGHHHHHHHHRNHHEEGKIGKQVKLAHARECCLLAARLFSAVWGSSLPHPPPHRPHLYGEYWAEELWPCEHAVDPLEAPSGRQLPAALLLGSLAFCSRRLIEAKRATLAMPLIALQEHLAWVKCRDISATVTARLLRCRALTSVGRIQAATRVLALLISTFNSDRRPVALPLASNVAMDVETSLSFNSGVRGGVSRWTIEPPPLGEYAGAPSYDDCELPSSSGNASTVRLLCDGAWMVSEEASGEGDAQGDGDEGAVASAFTGVVHAGFSADSSDALRIHAFSHRNERSVDVARSITLRRVELMVRIASTALVPKRDLGSGGIAGGSGTSDGPDAETEWGDDAPSTREELLASARTMIVVMLRQLHDDVYTLRCSSIPEVSHSDGEGDDEGDGEDDAPESAQAKRRRRRERAASKVAKAMQHADYASPISIVRDAKILKLRAEQCACLFMLARVALSQNRCIEAAKTAQRALRVRGHAIRLVASLIARNYYAGDGVVKQTDASSNAAADKKRSRAVHRTSFSITKLRVATGQLRGMKQVKSGNFMKPADTPRTLARKASLVPRAVAHRWVAAESEADAALEEILSVQWEVRVREISAQGLLARRRYEAVRVECDHAIALAAEAEDPSLGRRLGVLRARAFVAQGDPEHAAQALRKVLQTGRAAHMVHDTTHASAASLLALLLEQGVVLKSLHGHSHGHGKSRKRGGSSDAGSSSGFSGGSVGGSGSSAIGSAAATSIAGTDTGTTADRSEATGAHRSSAAHTTRTGGSGTSGASGAKRRAHRKGQDDINSVVLFNEAQNALVTMLKQHGWGVSLVAGGRPVWRNAPGASLLAAVKLRLLQALARRRLAAAVGKTNVHFLSDAYAEDGDSERSMAIEALS